MAKPLIWRGPGLLGSGPEAVWPDQEIPEHIAKLMDSDRIKQFKEKGKIAHTTKADDDAKIREQIAKNKKKASKTAEAPAPKTERGESQ